MSDFSVRSDNVDVEQIMRQIRARIREKRGVDYTEEEIRELANVKLEKFIDPKGVRSGLLEEYRRVSTPEAAAPNYAFGEETLYETHRGPIRWIRSLLRPLLKMMLNPNPLIQALHIQADLNQRNAERWARREQLDSLQYELIHNLVLEVTRNTLEVKTLKMRLESMASRLDFDERRARALEGVVQYRAGSVAPLHPPTGQPTAQPGQHNELDNEGNERRSRRRRRRGRRRPGEFRTGTTPGAGESASAGDETGGSYDEGADTSTGDFDRGQSADAPSFAEAPHEPGTPKPQSGEGGAVAPKPPSGEGGAVAPKPQSGEGG